MERIRCSPELILRANDKGELVFAILQACMVAISDCGNVTVSDLEKELSDKSQTSYLFSTKRLAYYVERGIAKGFWTVNKDRIYYISRKRILARYDGGQISSADVTIETQKLFSGTNGPARWANVLAWMHAAFLASRPHPERPVARATVEAELSLSQRRQRSYERRTDVVKEFQYALCSVEEGTVGFHVKSLASEGIHAWREDIDGESFLARQIPNVYSTSDVVVHSSTSRKRLNKGLFGTVSKSRDMLNAKRYFDETKKQLPTNNDSIEAPLYIKIKKNLWIDQDRSLLKKHYGGNSYS